MKSDVVASVILNWDCNLKCSYCCHATQKVRDTYKPLDDPGKLDAYSEVLISGGEPTLHPERLLELMRWKSPDAKVYLYTNGNDYTAVIQFMDAGGTGVCYSPHGEIDWFFIDHLRAYNIPLRVRFVGTKPYGKQAEALKLCGCEVDCKGIDQHNIVSEDRWDASKTIL